MAQKAALLIATSTAEAADLQVLGCTERLVLRRNGIDLSEFAHVAGGEAFRAQHGVASGERLVLYIGRISPIKNLETLVTAFARANLKNARLLLVGPQLEEDYARRLRSLISDLRMEDRVTLTGPLYAQDKFAALDAANLFVLPSLSESYGNSAAEAVAAGVPVLLTEGCGIAPSIHGRAGLSVPATAAGLAAGLHTLLDDARRRDALISRREEVLAELSWEEPLQQMIDLYESITGHEQTERLSGLGIRRTNVVIDERSSR
jgi:glycosyltransferase involved in cell wall biosynthesis